MLFCNTQVGLPRGIRGCSLRLAGWVLEDSDQHLKNISGLYSTVIQATLLGDQASLGRKT